MKKFLVIVLSLCLLVGCRRDKNIVHPENIEDKYRGSYYVELLKNYTCKDKNKNNTTNNEEFEDFLNNVFVETMESDYTTLHFGVVDYRQYGIEKPPVDFGEVKYELDTENIDYFLNQLQQLQSFDFDKLSYRQQIDYEALEYSIYETLASLCYYRYARLFTSGSDTVANLVSVLSDFTFYDQESIDDYMLLIEDFDRYIEDCKSYVEAQAKEGIYLLDVSIDNTKDYIETFVAKVDNNPLVVTFNDRLEKLDFVSTSQKAELQQKNLDVVKTEIIPCLEKLSRFLESYRGKQKMEESALCNFDKEYAEFVFILNSSSNKPIDETFEILNDVYDEMLATLNTAILREGAVQEYLDVDEGNILPTADAKETLQWIAQNLTSMYPPLGDVDYDVQELDESSGSDSVTAYYWPSPVDSLDQNIIRTNPNNMDAGFDSYSTLAHEGFPGHLYQHVYYFKSEPNNFRDVISFIGYTEGWAVSAQCDATCLLGLQYEETEQILNILNTYYFLEYSIIDIGFHYYGWDIDKISDYLNQEGLYAVINYLTYYEDYFAYGYNVSDIRAYFDEEGFYDEYAQMLLEYIVDKPGTFENYGVGYANMVTLRNAVKKIQRRDFDLIEYNTHVLENGPLPFVLLEKEVLSNY